MKLTRREPLGTNNGIISEKEEDFTSEDNSENKNTVATNFGANENQKSNDLKSEATGPQGECDGVMSAPEGGRLFYEQKLAELMAEKEKVNSGRSYLSLFCIFVYT